MPGHDTHEKISIVMLVFFILFLIHVNTNNRHIVIFCIFYIFATYYLSPDLDTNSRIYRRWGLLKWLWWPYLKLMKHRQSSHSIVLGPISILIYLGMIIISGLLIINYIIPLQLNGFSTDIPLLIVICVFLITEIHIIADKIF